MPTLDATTPNPSATTEVAPIDIGRFAGMLGAFQSNAYYTLKACKLDAKIAHKVAVDYGSDIGRMMRNDPDLSSKVAKANSEGVSKLTIKGGGKITTSRSMSMVRVAQQVDAIYGEGLLNSRELPELHPTLQKYVQECEKWASEQKWSE